MRIIFFIFLLYTSNIFSQFICKTKSKLNFDLRNKPSIGSKRDNGKILKNDEVKVISFKNGYWQIRKDTLTGWCPKDFLYIRKEMISYVTNDRAEKLKNKYDNKTAQRIEKGAIWIGMTEMMLLDSKGYPQKKNLTKLEGYTLEQWIYKNCFVYLEKGIVTAIQHL